MLVMGIDPGLTGGLAIVRHFEGRFKVSATWPMPILEDKSGSFGARKQVDACSVMAVYLYWANGAYENDLGALHVVIERQQAMPKQGVSSSFNNGMNYGLLLGALRAQVLPGKIWGVRGSAWKTAMGLSSSKAESRAKATALFGEEAEKHHWPRPSHEGKAEAALLAYWRAKRLAAMGGIT